MTVRFDDSLSRLVEAVMKAGVPLDADTVFLRDGVGRLTVARESLSVAVVKTLTGAVQSALGPYASIQPVVGGRMAKALVNDSSALTVSVPLPSGSREIRYIDRRFVGADWLTAPTPAPESGPPRLVFSSLKGGVGRSTALAVLAADLAARGRKALVIDLDLEAPGIGFMLLEESEDLARDRRPKYGVLDYLVENGLGGVEDGDLYDFIGVSPFADGFIHVIPVVGRVTDGHPASMLAKLSRAVVEDSGGAGTISFAQQVREMVDHFVRHGNYDAVLIDARAGLAESSAPAILALGARILFFGVDQPQTFRGYRYQFAHLLHCFGANHAVFDDWRERLSFVQAKAPSAAAHRSEFRDRLYDLCAEFLYDAERLNDDDTTELADFNFSVAQQGIEVPHDAVAVRYSTDYSAFDPFADRTRLDPDVYEGPYGAFLKRAWALLGLSREEAA
jgi:hypothetical protein